MLHRETKLFALLATQRASQQITFMYTTKWAGLSDVKGVAVRASEEGKVGGQVSEDRGWFPRRQPERQLSLLAGWLACLLYKPSII